MSRARTLVFILTSALLLAISGWLLGNGEIQAGEERSARLLVKCSKSQVAGVLRDIAAHDVEVWDLSSMKLVYAPAPTGEVPVLPDAGAVMDELLRVLEAPQGPAAGPLLRVTGMTIQEGRAVVKLQSKDAAAFDVARKALAASALLKARATLAPQMGAIRAEKSGLWASTASLRITDKGARKTPVKAGSAIVIAQKDVERAALVSKMQMQYASRTTDDPNRQGGYRTVSREYTFAGATLGQLKALLQDLKTQSGLTVYELRWRLAPEVVEGAGVRIGKCTIRVGLRLPLAQ